MDASGTKVHTRSRKYSPLVTSNAFALTKSVKQKKYISSGALGARSGSGGFDSNLKLTHKQGPGGVRVSKGDTMPTIKKLVIVVAIVCCIIGAGVMSLMHDEPRECSWSKALTSCTWAHP
jgi:hypothetical protein